MAEWHPKMNAYPVEWWCRNGRHADPYAVIRQIDARNPATKTSGAEFIVYRWTGTDAGEPLGRFGTGDDAAVFAWQWHLAEGRLQHRAAATREHERTQYANVPKVVERD